MSLILWSGMGAFPCFGSHSAERTVFVTATNGWKRCTCTSAGFQQHTAFISHSLASMVLCMVTCQRIEDVSTCLLAWSLPSLPQRATTYSGRGGMCWNQFVRMSKCPTFLGADDISLVTEPFVTKRFMMVHYHETECCAKRLLSSGSRSQWRDSFSKNDGVVHIFINPFFHSSRELPEQHTKRLGCFLRNQGHSEGMDLWPRIFSMVVRCHELGYFVERMDCLLLRKCLLHNLLS